ncbi:RNA polymerase sigma factor [Paenibacillus alkalitolerans]|uniref:RNA polymerase sigma factor n=1 Tax=Paenibacillus alkalitolerans TaxID=2799335 RepID=UPI0018F2C99B|nr:RNA polymerase sigma factor [Paenibacillus alkalitolerans]
MTEHGTLDAAFQTIYDRHYQGLFAFFVSKTGHREIAIELLQELFLKIWKQIAYLHSLAEANQRYWIYRVAQNMAADYYRKKGIRAEETMDSIPEKMISDHGQKGPAEIVEARESYRELSKAVNALPADLRTIFCMTSIGCMNSSEIGAALGLPSGTVRHKLMKARKLITTMMERSFGEGGESRCQTSGSANWSS